MLCSEVLSCALPQWYENFAKVTFDTRVLDLPDDVLAYLRGRGSVVLPVECESERWTPKKRNDNDEEEEDWEEEQEDEEEPQPSFPDFCQRLREAIMDLGGRVFVKLNWSSPRDASWIALGNNLAVEDLTQLFLLLKSSDFVRHDLTSPFKDCTDAADAMETTLSQVRYSVCLRRWEDINPGHEFRCFVAGGRLAAVAQRDPTHYYRHIGEDAGNVLTDLKSFFGEQLRGKFPLKDFVFDVVRRAKDEVSALFSIEATNIVYRYIIIFSIKKYWSF